MSDGRRPTLLAYLHHLGGAEVPESSDAELLERFVVTRDEAAFATLLRRHGPLVWGVCRRVLAEEHAAEDAFQATFLVLVRKAGSVSKRASVRSWLYGVALRVAVRARQRENVRRRHEQSAPPRQSSDAPEWSDIRPILDEEIGRLPEKYRLPLILCYLERRTNEEAAQQLNCPRGTLAVRLARARDKLRARLLRRGVTLSAGALTVLLADNAMSATMSPLLCVQTSKAILAGTPPASIAALTEGVLHAMFVSKIKTTLSVVLALTVVSGAGIFTFSLRGQDQEEEPIKLPAKTAPDLKVPAKPAEEMSRLLKQRRNEAELEAKVRYEKYVAGAQDVTLDLTLGSFRRLLKAELELNEKKADRLTALERHVKMTKEIAAIVNAKYKAGRVSKADFAQAEYERLDAEIALERERTR